MSAAKPIKKLDQPGAGFDLAHWIERQAEFAADKTALACGAERLSYAALEKLIRRYAETLSRRLAVGPGDRLALLGYNSPTFIALLFACARLGAMLVPLNWRLTAAEHAVILADAEPKALFCDPPFCADIGAALDDLPQLRDCRRVVIGGNADSDLQPGWLSHQALLAGADGDRPLKHPGPARPGLASPLLIVYTSGTTGRPKGAVLSQSALFWNAVNSTHMHDLTSADRILSVLPMFHVGGLNIQTLPALHAGASVLLHPRFDPGATLAACGSERPTLTVLVPATLRALLQHPDWAAADLSSLRCITTGSSIVPTALMTPFHRRGVPVIQVYGATETAPVAVYLRREDAERKLGSTGKPALHCRVRIVDPAGADLPSGKPGEILIAGPNLMDGYWRDPQTSAAALRDGWFYSGDIGHRDADGYFFIDDRKKDLIVSGGENIYPAELELVLNELAAVNEAAVVAQADERWGEVPVAFIETAPDAELDAAAVLAALDGRLARYKHPKRVVFIPALPRNAMGKVQKHRLRELAAQPDIDGG